jgi:putative peptidoglycan lipid II flippase
MAVSAAELPEMSGVLGDAEARAAQLRTRLASALRRVVFLVVPSAAAFLTIGDSIVQLLFQSGRFGQEATNTVWLLLAGSAIGLSAGTQGRLLASAFYALGDPRAPLRASLLRVTLTALAGWAVTLPLRELFGYDARWGAFGLTASAGVAAWLEFEVLRRTLRTRLGSLPMPTQLGFGALAIALIAGGAARFAAHVMATHGARGWLAALVAVAVFGVLYLGSMLSFRVPEAQVFLARVLRRRAARSQT